MLPYSMLHRVGVSASAEAGCRTHFQQCADPLTICKSTFSGDLSFGAVARVSLGMCKVQTHRRLK